MSTLGTEKISLNAFLNLNDFGLPDIEGTSYQTVGGIMSTGLAGGSTKYGVGDAILEIEMVNGRSEVVVYTRPVANQPTRAVGVAGTAPDSAAPAPNDDSLNIWYAALRSRWRMCWCWQHRW